MRPGNERVDRAVRRSASSKEDTRTMRPSSNTLKPHAASRTSNLTKKRLELSSLGLYERKHHLSQLRDAYLCVQQENGGGDHDHHGSAVQMVLIKGSSGTGKSAIVEAFREKIVQKDRAFFVGGKFEQNRGLREPYSAFAEALSQLCSDILNLDKKEQDQDVMDENSIDENANSCACPLSISIRVAVGPTQAQILVGIMPTLKRLLGHCESETDDSDDDSIPGVLDSSHFGPMARNRFDIAIRQFFRAVCSPSRPVVLFLDDLMWADTASLELLETLASDKEIRGLLFVGSYRDDEVDEGTHPLAATLRKIEKVRGEELGITQISMANLAMRTVNEFLSDLLCSDEPTTLELAEIVYKKTNGNALFVYQYLDSLWDNEYLYFSYAKSSWRWDVDRIRSETSVAGNVADLLHDKLQKKLSSSARDILRIAACLGLTFDEVTLAMVAENVHKRWAERGQVKAVGNDGAVCGERTDGQSGEAAPQSVDGSCGKAAALCLDTCVDEGLLERDIGKDDGLIKYRFAHDQIQLAAFNLTQEEDRDVLQLLAGWALVENISSVELNKFLFVAVNLLDNGIAHLPTARKPFLAKLNLQAGKKAMVSAAYVAAAKYFKTAIFLLGPNCWEDNYRLSLNLYCSLAEAEYSSGHITEMNTYVDEVLAQKELPFPDKFCAYSIQIKSLNHQGLYSETEDKSLYVLAQMGVKFPKYGRNLACFPELIQTKRLLSRRPASTLIDLPIMQEKEKIMVMYVMDSLATAAFFSGSDILPLVILRSMRWTLKFGICKYSSFSFFAYGFFLCSAFSEMKQGHEFGELALAVMDKFSAKDTEANTLASVHLLIDHWTNPVQSSLQPFLRGYQAGMESGDIEMGFYCIVFYCSYSFIAGRPLSSIEADLRAYTAQIRDYQQDSALYLGLAQWQLVLNLLGRSDCTTVLTGEAMDQELSLTHADETDNTMLRDYMKSYQMWLAYCFGDYDLAQRLVEELQVLVTTKATCLVWRSDFFEGLTAFAPARRGDTCTRKWKRRARKVMTRMTIWTKKGNVNCLHMVSLFEAEMAALEGQTDRAKAAYKEAISIAARQGLCHDKALANELAGEFFLESGDIFWATHYLRSACQLYTDWEAFAKANQLRQKHAKLLLHEDI